MSVVVMKKSPTANVAAWGKTNNKKRVAIAWWAMQDFAVGDTMKVVAGFLGERDAADVQRDAENDRITSWISGQDAGWMASAALQSSMQGLQKYDTVSSAPSSERADSDNGLSCSTTSAPATPPMAPQSRILSGMIRCDLGKMQRGPRSRGPTARFQLC